MHKLGGTLLVSGTCIGAGIIALPLTLVAIGLAPSLALILFVWFIIYYTSLFTVELNLQANISEDLSRAAKRFCDAKTHIFTLLILKFFSYSLLVAFLCGLSLILSKLLTLLYESHIATNEIQTAALQITKLKIAGTKDVIWHQLLIAHLFNNISLYISCVCILLLSLPIRLIDLINRLLFTTLLIAFAVVIFYLIVTIKWDTFESIPLFSEGAMTFLAWRKAILIVFYSFGFSVMLHTLTRYCKLRPRVLQTALRWGSFLPVIAYSIWTCVVLAALHEHNPYFYSEMIESIITHHDNAEVITQKTTKEAEHRIISVGEFVNALAKTANLPSMNLLIWVVSICAILTSILGVGAGLRDAICHSLYDLQRSYIFQTSIEHMQVILKSILKSIMRPSNSGFLSDLDTDRSNKEKDGRHLISFTSPSTQAPSRILYLTSAILTITPTYYAAALAHSAFLSVLSFAGMLSSIIGILLPIFLCIKGKFTNYHYPILQNKFLTSLAIIFAVAIVLFELFDVLSSL